jgi:hypothetical protein
MKTPREPLREERKRGISTNRFTTLAFGVLVIAIVAMIAIIIALF